MCKRLSLLNHEKAQYVEFFWAQVDSLAADLDHPSLKIDLQFRSLDFGKRLVGSRPPQRCSNARQQFSDCERLYDVIVRPRIQSDNLVMFRVADRHHDNRPFKRQSNLSAILKPTHVRHVYVQKNQIGADAANHFDGLLSVSPLFRFFSLSALPPPQSPPGCHPDITTSI